MRIHIDSSAHSDDPHLIHRNNWLRAAVLGANDGIVSISSLIVGVAAANPEPRTIWISGVAGLVAGAMSMAAGEYVSVSSQSDTERADILREKKMLAENPKAELEELCKIYRDRGLHPETAHMVAVELSEKNALAAHVRDELGLSEIHAANPMQAALVSGATFSIAAAIPVAGAIIAPGGAVIPVVLCATVLALAALGTLGAKAGGAQVIPAVRRVVSWGIAAMAATALVGWAFGVSIA